MTVHHLQNLDRLDPLKVARRRERLRPELDFWLLFASSSSLPPKGVGDGIGVMLPLSDSLLDALIFHRNWPISELGLALSRRPVWLYCPELDVFVSWSDYRTGLAVLLENVVLGDSLRP